MAALPCDQSPANGVDSHLICDQNSGWTWGCTGGGQGLRAQLDPSIPEHLDRLETRMIASAGCISTNGQDEANRVPAALQTLLGRSQAGH